MRILSRNTGRGLIISMFCLTFGCSKPHKRIYLKMAGFSIIPPIGWIDNMRKAPARIEKDRIKLGCKRYCLAYEKGYRYQDMYEFARLSKAPDDKKLKKMIKTIDGDMIFYDEVSSEYGNYWDSMQTIYSFQRLINHGSLWFNISYTTYSEKLAVENDLSGSKIPKEIADSVLSFKIEKKEKPNKIDALNAHSSRK